MHIEKFTQNAAKKPKRKKTHKKSQKENGSKKRESSKTARISLFNIQRPNQKAKQREGRGKNSREKEK